MKYKTTVIMAAFPAILLLGFAAPGIETNQAFAWGPNGWNEGGGCCEGGGGQYFHHFGDWLGSSISRLGETIGLGQPLGPGSYDNGYFAGTQDAIYDYNNGNSYDPVGQCLSCHSELYWNGFHAGYDAKWNILQNTEQTTTQGTSINIYGNNNYVNTAQNSGQSSGFSPESLGQNCEYGQDCGSYVPGP